MTSSPGGKTCTWTSGPLTCTVTGLTNGTSYTFTVTATNVLGDGAASDPSDALSAGVTPPPLPQNVLVFPKANGVIVHWNAPSGSGGSPIMGYVVTVTNTVNKVMGSCHTNAATTVCVVGGLTNSQSYRVTVVAENSKGMSPVAKTTGVPMVPPKGVIDHFAPKSYKVTRAMSLVIRQWAQLIAKEKYHIVGLTGNTSRELSSAGDISLGFKRTQAILGILKSELNKLHVVGVRFRIFSHGSNNLVVSTYRSSHGATRRRVDIGYGNSPLSSRSTDSGHMAVRGASALGGQYLSAWDFEPCPRAH